MKTDEVKFGHFFSTAKTQYVIPRWQRRFSWTSQEVDELWEDIKRVGREVAEGRPLTHFLGSVVVQHNAIEQVVKPSEAHRFLVIDGQQRLASMALFLCALRDCDQGTISAGREEITSAYLTNSNLGGNSRARIVLQPADDEALQAIVGGFRYPDPPHLVVQTYERFRTHLNAALTVSDFGDTVQERADTFLMVATEYLTAVWMALDSQDNAHRIFQTINAGGRPLQHVDLVRNFFFLRLSANQSIAEDFFDDHWVPMEERLAGASIAPKTYMQSWSNLQGRLGTADQLYQNVVKDLEHKLPEQVVAYGVEFTKHSSDFLPLVADVSTSHPELDSELVRFRLLRQAPQSLYGLLFSALVFCRRGQISGSDAALVVRSATGYLVRRQLSGFATQLHNATFRDVVLGFVSNVRTGKCRIDDLSEYVRARLSLGTDSRSWPNDATVVTRGVFADLYTSGRRTHLTRVVLGELDRSLRGYASSGFTLHQYVTMHIEHIMPQSLSAMWLQDFHDWGVAEPAQKHELYLHTIGNLTLLESEPSIGIGNSRFVQKREECYSTESLVITSNLGVESIWTDREIAKRAGELLQRACSLFDGPMSGSELMESTQKFDLNPADLESSEADDDAEAE